MTPQQNQTMPSVSPEMIEQAARSLADQHGIAIPDNALKAFCRLYDVDDFDATRIAQALQGCGAISWDSLSLQHLRLFEETHKVAKSQAFLLRAAWMTQHGIAGKVRIGSEKFPNTLRDLAKDGIGQLVNTTKPGDKTPQFTLVKTVH